MAPIYESDVAEKRWAESEWSNYELWEKVEVRLRRVRRLWIGGAVAVFLLISSIPIIQSQRPKWLALSAVRSLGEELNRLKREASLEHSAFRIRFAADGSLKYLVERLESCSSSSTLEARTGAAVSESRLSRLALVNPEAGERAGIPGLVTSFCYDPITGSEAAGHGNAVAGFAIAPAEDLQSNRFDRISILLLTGPSAEVSFE